jgi:CHAT domain-containing protein/Flp pilus assembly protein TadD
MKLLKLKLSVVVVLLASQMGLPVEKVSAQYSSMILIAQATGLEEAERLNQKAIQLYEQGKYDEAVPLAEQALVIRKRVLGDRHSDVAVSLNNLAELHRNQGRYEKAEPLYLESLELLKSLLGNLHPNVATNLNNLALLYASQGRYEKAEPLYLESLRLRKSLLGDRHPDVAVSLNNLAELYRNQGRYEKAEPLYLESLELLKSLLGDRHPNVATNLNNLALLYVSQGRYEKAEPFLLQALELRKLLLGDRHPDVAVSLNNLAMLYANQGLYEKAELFYIQTLKLQKSLLGDRHPNVATNLNNLALLYVSQGRYEKAEPFLLQALELRKSLLGDRHPDVAVSLNNLAMLYANQGLYEKAELLYIQTLKLQKSLLGDRHPNAATYLNSMALLYVSQGRYEKAAPLYIQALELQKSLLGERHPDVAISLNNLAGLYMSQGLYEEAELLFLKALELRKSLLGDRHPDVATSLNDLAVLYVSQGRYEKAELLLLQALELQKSLLGERHPNVSTGLNNLALLYMSQGRYEKAELLLLQALELQKSLLGERHPNLASSSNNLAFLYQSQGRYEKAIAFLAQGMKIEEINLITNLAIGAEDQKRDYLTKFNITNDASISLHLQQASTNPKAMHLAFTNILRRKGRILGTLTDSLNQIRQNLTPPLQAQLDDLSATQTQLATLYQQGLGKLSSDQYRARLTELEQKSTQLSESLSLSSAAFKTAIQPITPESIQQQIPKDTALIELIQYKPFNPKAKQKEQWGTPHYAAYIFTHSGTLKAIDLGPIQPINEALTLHRQNLQDNATPIPQIKTTARNLDALLMQPIRQHLGNTRNLLLSPDSNLNLLPFETLVDENNKYLLETHTITYLTSGRDLQRLTTPKTNNNPSLILADPYFGKPGTLATTRIVDLKKLIAPPLPGTRTEATALGKLLNTQPLLGTDATETAIKQTKSPKILHIATHGFFQPTPDKSNPLLNSGLVLAGFQVGKSGNDDGILTALEVSNLNLTGTKLVTLSACETGLGTTSNGEGIYGLRRALTIAGAESQVISLWKVADDATKDLMINYYTRLNQGEGRSIALHNAQRDMLKSEDYSHPYYWAAFIPSGDWRPLGN